MLHHNQESHSAPCEQRALQHDCGHVGCGTKGGQRGPHEQHGCEDKLQTEQLCSISWRNCVPQLERRRQEAGGAVPEKEGCTASGPTVLHT